MAPWPPSIRALEGDLGAASIPIAGAWGWFRYRKARKEKKDAIIARLGQTVAVMAQKLDGHCELEQQHHEVVATQLTKIERTLEDHIMLTHGVRR